VTQVRQEQSHSGGGQPKEPDNSMATTLSIQEQEEFHQVLQKTQLGLQELKKIVTRDLRDIKILMQEVGVKSGSSVSSAPCVRLLAYPLNHTYVLHPQLLKEATASRWDIAVRHHALWL
jgi:hypothetical protein